MSADNVARVPLYADATVWEDTPILRPGHTCPVCGAFGDARHLHIVAGQDCLLTGTADRDYTNKRNTTAV